MIRTNLTAAHGGNTNQTITARGGTNQNTNCMKTAMMKRPAPAAAAAAQRKSFVQLFYRQLLLGVFVLLGLGVGQSWGQANPTRNPCHSEFFKSITYIYTYPAGSGMQSILLNVGSYQYCRHTATELASANVQLPQLEYSNGALVYLQLATSVLLDGRWSWLIMLHSALSYNQPMFVNYNLQYRKLMILRVLIDHYDALEYRIRHTNATVIASISD
ncbi:MAG: hypothetical protein V9F01_07915 [Chitinophagaceae bacterium]